MGEGWLRQMYRGTYLLGSFLNNQSYTCNNFTALCHYFGCFRTYLSSILRDMGKSSVTNFYREL